MLISTSFFACRTTRNFGFRSGDDGFFSFFFFLSFWSETRANDNYVTSMLTESWTVIRTPHGQWEEWTSARSIDRQREKKNFFFDFSWQSIPNWWRYFD
jgi:hypothetical protein